MDRQRLVELFLGESRDHLSAAYETLEGMEDGDRCPDALRELMRHAHSLKGMAMSLGFSSMEALAHALEDLFESLGQASPERVRALTPLALDALFSVALGSSSGVESVVIDMIVFRIDFSGPKMSIVLP